MGKFEIEGYAKRKVRCDLAIVHISFRAIGKNPHELSKKVLNECDDFIKSVSKLGVTPKDIQLESDRTDTRSYDNGNVLETKREIIIRIPFNVKLLNRIQGALQKGKYDYTMYISGDISYHHQLLAELSQEALNNSKDIAEKLAASSDMKVKGIESIRKDYWDDEDDRNSRRVGEAGAGDILGLDFDDDFGGPRAADEIEAKYIEEDVRLKITWNIA